MSDKIKVLALCDSPTSATGFAQVARNVLDGLAKTGKYDITVVGINYFGDYYDHEQFPYKIFPAMPQGYQDMYGRGRLLGALAGQEEKFGLKGPYDIVFTIQDPFIIEGLGVGYPFAEQLKVYEELWKRTVDPAQWFKWIGYFPVDSDLKENWVTRSIALCDFPVAYCEWGKQQMMKFDREKFETTFDFALQATQTKKKVKLFTPALKDRLNVIHHGTDLNVFKPLPANESRAFRKSYFGALVKDDTYLVVNISRNQPRKDLSRTLKVFSEFKKQVSNSHLYLHCKTNDAGGSVHEMARNFGLIPGKDYSVPDDFNAGVGYPVETVNKLYNAADLCMTTTLGEGWGFITTEAMATKTPIVAPYITSIIDIFGGDGGPYSPELLEGDSELRGIPVIAGSTSSEWVSMGLEDNERVRPLTNVDDMVAKMVWAHDHPKLVAKIVDRAFTWVQTQGWDPIVAKWDAIFEAAYSQLSADRSIAARLDKAGRNDPCPCGSGLKFKKCHGSPDKVDHVRDWVEQTDP